MQEYIALVVTVLLFKESITSLINKLFIFLLRKKELKVNPRVKYNPISSNEYRDRIRWELLKAILVG